VAVVSAFDIEKLMHEAGAVALNWGGAAALPQGQRFWLCSRPVSQGIRQMSV